MRVEDFGVVAAKRSQAAVRPLEFLEVEDDGHQDDP